MRLVEPVRCAPGAASPRALVLQVSVCDVSVPMNVERLVRALAPMGRCLAAAYDLAAGAAALRESALMSRVSVTQRPILQLLVAGLSEADIARSIHRSPHTVHDHIKSIYAALGVSSRFELLQLWVGKAGRGGTGAPIESGVGGAIGNAVARAC